jgi:23S rRNA (cytidine1920-2'-O)/16S rRNA (cytidine1409-2'-O)-methyltransferase
VYAVDTGYGALDYQLRRDPRVVVMERTNAMHVRLPEPVDLVTIDVGWTRQKHILPAARAMAKPDGRIISLIKPHYEAEASLLRDGVLAVEQVEHVVESVASMLGDVGLVEMGRTFSPLPGHGGNQEVFLLLCAGQR